MYQRYFGNSFGETDFPLGFCGRHFHAVCDGCLRLSDSPGCTYQISFHFDACSEHGSHLLFFGRYADSEKASYMEQKAFFGMRNLYPFYGSVLDWSGVRCFWNGAQDTRDIRD